jgi:tRNA (adenine37-N6)-methyltransferase
MVESFTFKPIGVIHKPYKKKDDTPIQGCFCPNNQGSIELYPEYAEGLQNIKGFSHLILLYH